MNVRFGILGLGWISTRFARVLQTMEGVELAAVAGRDLDRARDFGQTYGAQKAYDNYMDLIADDSVDAVYIGLLNNRHLELGKICLEHHKAVLCEKPLTTSQKDTEEFVNLARANQTLLMEAMWTRCQPAYLAARDWVQAGKIGPVRLITANFSHPLPYAPGNRFYDPVLGGGSLFDLGVYTIELTTGILGQNPVSASGIASITSTGVDESAAFSLRFADGCLASLACSFTVMGLNDAVIYGPAGRIQLDSCFAPVHIERYDADGQLIESYTAPEGDGFAHQIRHFADLYRQGKLESDLVPWADTITCAGVFDSLRSQWGLV
jgi:predicted dehydrogenase